jgi:uncharacterized RDD family membrane protein YckC
MVVAVIFSNTTWTFWDVMLFFFLWIPLVMVWFFCMFDVFTRRDLSGAGKALWLLAIVILPWIGTFAYVIARPWSRDAYAPGYDSAGTASGSPTTAPEPSAGGPVRTG